MNEQDKIANLPPCELEVLPLLEAVQNYLRAVDALDPGNPVAFAGHTRAARMRLADERDAARFDLDLAIEAELKRRADR